MRNTKIITLTIFLIVITNILSASVFDDVKWDLEKYKKNISLYVQRNKETKINYYKAQISVDNVQLGNLLTNILSFNDYNIIFDRTKYFKILKQINDNHFAVVAELNFFPYRNRYYYIECKYQEIIENDKTTHIVEWSPLNPEEHPDLINKIPIAKKVDFIHGRWTMIEESNKKINVTLEYHNNWETNLPFSWVTEVEKLFIVKNLTSMLKYTVKK